MDVIGDLAYPLPVTVICDMLGVPAGDHEQIKEWSSDIIRSLDAIGIPSDESIVERGRIGRRGIADYFRALLPERRRHPRADLLLLAHRGRGAGRPPHRGRAARDLRAALHRGPRDHREPDRQRSPRPAPAPAEVERLRREPALIGGAVEELLRYDSPVQRTARITNAEVELGGKTIPKGAFVVTAIGAANRDPAHFPDPDRLDVARPDNRHIAFGFGIHFCLGAPLARVEGQLALGTLLRRMPRLRLGAEALAWRESSTLRGLKALPVEF